MAQEAEQPSSPRSIRHSLLVYRNLGKRYRSPGILLMLLGLALFLPSFFGDLQSESVEPEVLAGVGTALLLVGMAFWLFARLAMRRAYVEITPDLLVIRTPFYLTRISYRRISHVKSVRVADLFPSDSLKGMGRPLMRPLVGMTALEVVVRSWPAPRRRLRRFLSEFLFSPRDEAWVFIVPNYSRLMTQLEAAMHRKADRDRQQAR